MDNVFTSIPGEKANAEYMALEASIGRALSSWMDIEAQTQQSFGIAMQAQNSATRAVFKAAINANARLAMANEAITQALTDLEQGSDLLARWTKLYDRAKKLAKRRNAVAHGRPVVIISAPDSNRISRGLGARIIDPLSPTFLKQTPHEQMQGGISLKQLTEMSESFNRLACDIYAHGQEMGEAIRRSQEFPAR